MFNASLVEGKTSMSCFHSFHLTNISPACIIELSHHALLWLVVRDPSRAGWDFCLANGGEWSGWKEESVSLGNCCPSVLPIHKYDWEFEEFAKGYVIPMQCQEEDRPDITQAGSAGADKPCTVQRWEGIQQPYHLKKSEIKRNICSQLSGMSLGNWIIVLAVASGCFKGHVFLLTLFALKPTIWMTAATHIMDAYCFAKNTTVCHINTHKIQNSTSLRLDCINNSFTIHNTAGFSVIPAVKQPRSSIYIRYWWYNNTKLLHYKWKD